MSTPQPPVGVTAPPVTAAAALDQPDAALGVGPIGAVLELPATPGRPWVLAQIRHSYTGNAGGQLFVEWDGGTEEQYVGQFGQLSFVPPLVFPPGSRVLITLAGVGGGPEGRLGVTA